MIFRTSSITQNEVQQKSKPKKYYQDMELYLQTQPDLYLIVSDKIYPSHKRVLKSSQYVQRFMEEDQKILIVDMEINQKPLELSLGYLYSSQLNFQRSKEIFEILTVSKQMGIISLSQYILADFQQNFYDYNFFKLYSTSLKWDIKQLRQRCEQQLMKLSYQQININRLDLLQMDKSALEQMIRNHQKLKVNKLIDGVSRKQLESIIIQYNKYHHLHVNIEDVLAIKEEYYDFQRQRKVNMSITEKKPIRKPIVKRKSISCNLSDLAEYGEGKNENASQRVNPLQKNQSNRSSQNQIEDKLKNNEIRDKFIDLQCVSSPLVDLCQDGSSFEYFTFQNDNEFMNIQNQKPFSSIIERDPSQQNDSKELSPRQISYKKGRTDNALKNIPHIRKDILF